MQKIKHCMYNDNAMASLTQKRTIRNYPLHTVALRITQLFAPMLARFILTTYGKTELVNKPVLSSEKQYIFVSNHPSYYDAPGAFSVFTPRELTAITPLRFMTSGAIYYGPLRPFLAACGCYPTRKLRSPSYNAINTTLAYLATGQNIYICPEGRRVKSIDDSNPKDGIIRILAAHTHPVAIILIHISWKRRGLRPVMRVAFQESVERSSVTKMMSELYSL